MALQELAQVDGEVVGGGIAVGDVLGQRLLQDRQQRVVLGAFRDRVVVGVLVGDLVEDRHQVLGAERAPARQELVEHAADAEQVGAAVDLGAFHLLGRHVVGGADDRAGPGHRRGGEPRHAEVHDLHRAVVVQEDVGGLDVAVHDAGLVSVCQPRQHLHQDVDLLLHAHRRHLPHRLLEVVALEQLHRHVRRAIGVVTEVEDVHHVRVLHPRDGLRLAVETLLQLLIVGDRGDHHLERDLALEHLVLGQVHLTHGALAENPDDLVLADPARQILDDGSGGLLLGLAHGPVWLENAWRG